MIILEIRQRIKPNEGELPTIGEVEEKHITVQQQFFVNEEEEKVERLHEQIKEYFKSHNLEQHYYTHLTYTH